MNDATKKHAKIVGVTAAVLTVLLLIALMFAILGVGGFLGRTITKDVGMSYAELGKTDLAVPLISTALPGNDFTAYAEEACLDSNFEKGKVACVAYEYQNSRMYFAVAKQGAVTSLDLFSFEGSEAGTSAALGSIYAAQIKGGGAAIYYAEKDGVRYALIPFGASAEQAIEDFNSIFTFD